MDMKIELLKFMNTLDMKDLPEEYKSKETSRLEHKILCLKRELLKGNMTKEDIKAEFGVDDYVIEAVVNQMYAMSFTAGEYVTENLGC